MVPRVRIREMPYKLTILLSIIIGEFCLGSASAEDVFLNEVVDSGKAPIEVKAVPAPVSHDLSSFQCVAPGYFSLPGFCNVFIYCEELPDHGFLSKPFMCPQGTTLHKETETCLVSSQVDLEANCTDSLESFVYKLVENEMSSSGTTHLPTHDEREPSATQNLGKRDVSIDHIHKREVYRYPSVLSNDVEGLETGLSTCTQGTVREIASYSEEICLQIVNIGKYVTSIAQMAPVPLDPDAEDTTSFVVEYYNSVLQKAKGNVNKWRSGNSLLNGIKKSFELAKGFETTFNKKYDVYQRISKSPRSSKEAAIAKLNGEIEELEGEIQEIQGHLDHAVSPVIRKFFEVQIKDKQKTLEEKRFATSVDPNASMDMKELQYFLGEIVVDADNVQKSALGTLQQIRPFIRALSTDKTGFDLAIGDVKSALHKSQTQSARESEDLARMQERQNKLTSEYESLMQEVSGLYESVSNTYRESKDEMWNLIQKYRKVKDFQNILNAFSSLDLTQLFGLGGSIEGNTPYTPIDLKSILKPLWDHATLQEKHVISKWESNMKQSQTRVERFETRIQQKQQELFRWREMMADNERNTKNLRNNLRSFNVLDFYLQDIAMEIPSIDWSMEQIQIGLQKIAGVYSRIVTSLKSMIDSGMKATTTEELTSVKQTILSHLLDLQCYWEHSSIVIADLNSCSAQDSSFV